jgi:hypothetical protein
LVKLVEEKGEGIKCQLTKRISSIGEYDAELIVVECIDYTTFPISKIAVPVVWVQELSEICRCSTIEYAKEYIESRESALVDLVFEWIRSQNCKAKKLWEILSSLGLDNIINFNQVANLFVPDLSLLK